jgi:SAM-dependent methyltransferase
MVHALEEIRRLLKPNGRLIDLHPFAEARSLEVHLDGRVAFAEPVPESGFDDELEADDALAQIVQRRLFVVERSSAFDSLICASSVAELQDYQVKMGAYDDRPREEAVAARRAELAARVEQIRQAAGKRAEVAYRERGRIARLRPVR